MPLLVQLWRGDLNNNSIVIVIVMTIIIIIIIIITIIIIIIIIIITNPASKPARQHARPPARGRNIISQASRRGQDKRFFCRSAVTSHNDAIIMP